MGRRNIRWTDDDDDYDSDPPAQPARTMHEMYIGHFEALKEFYAIRFRELTMKPLRQIVTAWVKTLEPNRLRTYGRYHEEATLEGNGPPWWPRDIPYREPSHLRCQGIFLQPPLTLQSLTRLQT